MRISGNYLRCAKQGALRRRVWYKALDRLERGIIDLTINLVDSVKSEVLSREISKILDKLEAAMCSRFARHCMIYGMDRLRRVVEIAWGFGSRVCSEWYTEDFAKLLTVNDLNNQGGWNQVHA